MPGQNTLDRLSTKHRTVIRMLVNGQERSAISMKTGYTSNSISRLTHDPLFSRELARRMEEKQRADGADSEQLSLMARSRLGELSLKAANKLGDIIDSDDERTAIMASEAVLDRALPRKQAEGPNGNFGLSITDATINLFLGVMNESSAMDQVPAAIEQLEGATA